MTSFDLEDRIWFCSGSRFFALAGLLPVIQWLGEFNASLPLPEFLRSLEDAQLKLIEKILSSDIWIGSTVFALAITPALCEELLFRGYLQRQFERSFGIFGGIVATGPPVRIVPFPSFASDTARGTGHLPRVARVEDRQPVGAGNDSLSQQWNRDSCDVRRRIKS